MKLARFWARFRGWQWWQQALVWLVFAPLPIAAWAAAGSRIRWIVTVAAIALWALLVVAAVTPQGDDGPDAAEPTTVEPPSRTTATQPSEPSGSEPPATTTSTTRVVSSPTTSAPSSPPSTAAPARPDGESRAGTALVLLDGLAVEPEHEDGYDRDRFEHWVDADGDGCDTRAEVLAAESLGPLTYADGCRVSTGAWISLYDDAGFTLAADLDVDHLVPLAEAWGSGAWTWDSSRRREFANDLANPEALIAVSATSNRSKGASDPAEWLPPARDAQCGYARDWIVVKSIWSLTVDAREATALRSILDDCDSAASNGTLVGAAQGRPLPTPPPTPPTDRTASESIPPAGCDPGYAGACVPLFPPDVDCGDVDGPVQVLGPDPHRLDGDGDGIGCE